MGDEKMSSHGDFEIKIAERKELITVSTSALILGDGIYETLQKIFVAELQKANYMAPDCLPITDITLSNGSIATKLRVERKI